MKKISAAFAYIFSDKEWFNKVLVGGFFFLLIPAGIGMVMLNGFIDEFVSGIHRGEKTMPYWRNYRTLIGKGVRNSLFSLAAAATVYILILGARIVIPVSSAILLLAIFITINTVQITRTFTLFALAVSLLLLLTAISIGWMWIVVGWPLLIFLAMLVQAYLFTVK